jgi:hypothetical protein
MIIPTCEPMLCVPMSFLALTVCVSLAAGAAPAAPCAPAAAFPAPFLAALLTALLAALLLAPAPALAAAPEAPELTVGSPVKATEATVYGILDPGLVGAPGTYETGAYRFLYKKGSASCEGEGAAPASPGLSLGAGHEELPAETLTGLTANTEYTVCLRIETAGGTTVGPAVTFSTPTAPPLIGAESATNVLQTVATLHGEVDPEHSATTYHFEYGPDTNYGTSIPVPDGSVGSGTAYVAVSRQPIGLKAETTYHYRLTATNVNSTVHGPDQSFTTLPVPPPPGSGHCPNEALRTGPSANLPDCRAYEQVTPSDKEGAEDIFRGGDVERTAVGQDGEHFLLYQLYSKWGKDVSSGQNNNSYVFSRTPAAWRMTSLSPQPQTGGTQNLLATIFTPDLSQFLIEPQWQISLFKRSTTLLFALGPAGGPYTTVASEPDHRLETEHAELGSWTVQSADGSVAILATPDHELIPGHLTPTTTPTSGEASDDLYEYSAQAGLRQLNVDSAGNTIGTCGAKMVRGIESKDQKETFQNAGEPFEEWNLSSEHAVSANGRRAFFYAGFGAECPTREELKYGGGGAVNLYMREGGQRTVDIGAYHFEGANPEGSRLLLSRGLEFFSYDTETQAAKHLFSVEGGVSNLRVISEDGNVFYFETGGVIGFGGPPGGGIFRYDIAAETVRFVGNLDGGGGGAYTSPDGRYFYTGGGISGGQIYRYDNAEGVAQCISCASPFDPAPGTANAFMPINGPSHNQISPLGSPASANGDFVFFTSLSELVPADINGEIGEISIGEEFSAQTPSTDIYEWRKNGIDGCTAVQGCLALISNGINGAPNILLGTTPSGRDVFFATHAQLAAGDGDTSGDVYDARIGGGFPTPPRSVQCEADACRNPAPPPAEPTLATSVPNGPGNPAPVSTTVKPKVKKCAKGRVRKKGRCVKRPKAKKIARRAARQHRGGSK